MFAATTPASRILLDGFRDNGVALAGASVLLSLHQACEAAIPILIGVIVDRAIEQGDVGALTVWIAVLAGVFALLTTAYRFGARLAAKVAATRAHRLRVATAERILHPRGIDTSLRSGEQLTVASTDADETATLLEYTPHAVGALVAVVVSAVALLSIDVPLGAAIIIGVPVLLLLLHVGAPALTRRVLAQQESIAETGGAATDLIAGLRPLRGIGAEESAATRYRAASRLALGAMLRASKAQGIFAGVAGGFSALLAIGVAVLAGWFAFDGGITIGELITVVGLAQFVLEPLTMLSLLPSRLATSRASAERLTLIATADHVRPDLPPVPIGPGPHDIVVRDLRLRSLDGLNLAVRAGEYVGVVAADPADAEALADALAGEVVPPNGSGEVLISGVPVHRISLAESPRSLLVEPHVTDLFTGSVGANLTAGAPDVTEDGLYRALEAASAVDIVDAHPHGLAHTMLERGKSLSGGQRQRLALARALVADPAVLVLHDPTTAVDAVTERAIADGLTHTRHTERRFTTVLLTSSPALLAAADRVVLIEHGKVRAQGTHTELTTTDHRYRAAVLR
ncbi:ABC transporter ATP-binding protein [Aldersonia kunmingensis]|uniref:ABC transporter ATP-binding protein n=1 Tax=Aldersonia kunmingensis TaxID=408066 RepID=UPI000835B46B|nr:ABC transporter ATP-binding protein [Aldersonia kunmingensis]